MKTTMLFKAVAFMAMSIFGLTANASGTNEGEYFTNYIMKGDVIESKMIYHMDGNAIPYMKYDYTYDDMGRVTDIQIYKWEERGRKWKQNYCTSYTYEDGKIQIEYAYWNEKDKSYNKNIQKYECDMIEENMPVISENH